MTVLATALATALTRALIDFIWQGVLFACLLWIALILLRNRSAQARYLVSCAALLMMSAAPVITVYLAYRPVIVRSVGWSAPMAADWVGTATPTGGTPWLPAIQAWALPVWSVGVVLFSFRLIWGCFQVSGLRRCATRAHEDIRCIVERLASRMGVSRTVRILLSIRADTPSVAGILRPLILLPVSSLTGLTPQQLEAILAHELAHIRRYDTLVNVMQILVETLLFYHPAIWWTSARIRHERELCCDDLALRCCGDALCYARALTALEKLRVAPVTLALGSTDGPLLYRIRRIIGIRIGVRISDCSPSKVSGILALALAAACLAIHPTTRIHAQNAPPPSTIYRNAGVQADTAGAEVVEPIRYPGPALEKAIQGTVVVQLDVDAQGNVNDARVLSGPPELRKAVLRSVLTWRFKSEGTPSTRQISVAFQVPSKDELDKMRENVEPADAARREQLRAQLDMLRRSADSVHQNHDQQRAALEAEIASQAEVMESEARRRAEMDAASADRSDAEAESARRRQQMLAIEETEAVLRAQQERFRQSAGDPPQVREALEAELAAVQERLRSLASRGDAEPGWPGAMAGRTLAQIDVTGLADEQRDQLIKQLPVKLGDTLSHDAIEGLRPAIRAFNNHLRFELAPLENNLVILKIALPNGHDRIERLVELNRQIRETESQIDVTSRSLTASHPEMLALMSKLDSLRKQAVELSK